jgi:hypothetical protein
MMQKLVRHTRSLFSRCSRKNSDAVCLVQKQLRHAQHGFIMLTTLLLVALMTALGTYFFQRGMVHIPYMHVMVNREKARMLALSGIEIAIGQLIEPVKEEKKDDAGAQPGAVKTQPGAAQTSSDSDEKKFAQRLIPLLNRWQKFTLKNAVDGIDGEIGIMIVAEDGKLPINELYDFKKHTFKNVGKPQGDTQKLMQDLCARIEKRMGGKGLFEGLSTFLKNRKEPLDDVTELIMIPGFKNFKYAIFRDPPRTAQTGAQQKQLPEKEQQARRKKLFLTDLFTVASGQETVQPWAFSSSVQELFELVSAADNSAAQNKERLSGALKNFKQKMTWPADWKASLGVLYGKDFTSLPNSIQSMLDTTFEPMTFSVVTYGTMNGVTQRLFSIVERQKVATKAKKKSYIGKMKRLYWF